MDKLIVQYKLLSLSSPPHPSEMFCFWAVLNVIAVVESNFSSGSLGKKNDRALMSACLSKETSFPLSISVKLINSRIWFLFTLQCSAFFLKGWMTMKKCLWLISWFALANKKQLDKVHQEGQWGKERRRNHL